MSLLKRCLFLCLLAAPGYCPAQSVRDTQEQLIAWVDTQKDIAETRAEWKAEKEIVSDLIGLLENEKATLLARIEELENSSDAADAERAELNAARERLLAANAALAEVIPALEERARGLLSQVPPPLEDELAPLVRRLPDDGTESGLPISQRLLTVVGLLNKIDKFNTGITLTSEIRSIGDASVEVKTLYFGLAGAYFASENASYAGLGKPGSDGWDWTEDDAIADQVVALIKTYEGAREATFVKLPVAAN